MRHNICLSDCISRPRCLVDLAYKGAQYRIATKTRTHQGPPKSGVAKCNLTLCPCLCGSSSPLQKHHHTAPLSHSPSLCIRLRQVHADVAQQTHYIMTTLAVRHHLALDDILELVDVVLLYCPPGHELVGEPRYHEAVEAGCHRTSPMIFDLTGSGREPEHVFDDTHDADHQLQLPVHVAGHLTDEQWRSVFHMAHGNVMRVFSEYGNSRNFECQYLSDQAWSSPYNVW